MAVDGVSQILYVKACGSRERRLAYEVAGLFAEYLDTEKRPVLCPHDLYVALLLPHDERLPGGEIREFGGSRARELRPCLLLSQPHARDLRLRVYAVRDVGIIRSSRRPENVVARDDSVI